MKCFTFISNPGHAHARFNVSYVIIFASGFNGIWTTYLGGETPDKREIIPTSADKTQTTVTDLPKAANQTAVITSDPIVNPHPFSFIISNEDACAKRRHPNGDVFLAILVKCRAPEVSDREQIRRTWGGVKEVLGRRVLTMFLIGHSSDPAMRRIVQDEDSNNHDIIMEDFEDTYYNLTYKNLMGWKWVSSNCPNASYALTIDADMMLNIRNLVLRLEKMPRTNFTEGNLRIGYPPIKLYSSKWYISKDEYPKATYPPFLNGGCYAMSLDVASAVFKTSAYVPFFKLDDVYIGMVLAKAGIKPHFSPYYQQFEYIPDIHKALQIGIGIGIPHNVGKTNQTYINMWQDVVGSLLERDKEIAEDLFKLH